MVRFECDWCRVLKEPDETWIVGYAAENVGVTAARREVTVLAKWDRDRAVHPFAVHFCSIEHKDNYMAALFDATPTVVVEKVNVRNGSSERSVVTRTAKKRTTTRRRAS
jgi:hypothetical protein